MVRPTVAGGNHRNLERAQELPFGEVSRQYAVCLVTQDLYAAEIAFFTSISLKGVVPAADEEQMIYRMASSYLCAGTFPVPAGEGDTSTDGRTHPFFSGSARVRGGKPRGSGVEKRDTRGGIPDAGATGDQHGGRAVRQVRS